MSEEIRFSKNYSDRCVSQGVDAGFQFEFYCAWGEVYGAGEKAVKEGIQRGKRTEG